MAPPRKTPDKNANWFADAYINMPEIKVEYEIDWNDDVIRAGDEVKIKYERGVFKFRCLAFNTKLDTHWIDVLASEGQWRSFSVNKLKGPAKKRSRRKKKNG